MSRILADRREEVGVGSKWVTGIRRPAMVHVIMGFKWVLCSTEF